MAQDIAILFGTELDSRIRKLLRQADEDLMPMANRHILIHGSPSIQMYGTEVSFWCPGPLAVTLEVGYTESVKKTKVYNG